MKIKQAYISDKNFENLKGINASALINKLLEDYFENERGRTEEELLQELQIKKIELDALKKIGDAKNGHIQIRE